MCSSIRIVRHEVLGDVLICKMVRLLNIFLFKDEKYVSSKYLLITRVYVVWFYHLF